MKYQCLVCKFVFDEEKEGVKWHELREEWKCPKCRFAKHMFVPRRNIVPTAHAQPRERLSG